MKNEICISHSSRVIFKRVCVDVERHYAGRNPGRYHTHDRCHHYSLISITLIFSPLKCLLPEIPNLRLLITPLLKRAVWGLCIAGMGQTGFYGTHQSEVCLREVSPYREYKTPASYKCDAPGNAIYVTSPSSPQPAHSNFPVIPHRRSDKIFKLSIKVFLITFMFS